MFHKKGFINIFSNLDDMKVNDKLYLVALSKIKMGYLIGQSNKIDDIKIATPEDWLKVDKLPMTAQWHFHRIGGGCGLLLPRWSTENAKILNSIIVNWITANELTKGFPESDQAWSGHTVGLRLDFMCCYYAVCIENNYQIFDIKKIEESINYHLYYLLDKSNYDGNWNHGLDQSIALLKASYLFNNNEGNKVAVDRIFENFNHSFNSEGVNVEQSIMYHDYNVSRFSFAFKLLNMLEINSFYFKDTFDKAILFLLHSLTPDGYYSMIGDSIHKQPLKENRDSYIEYLVTASKSGLKPNFDKKIVYNGGYVFGRSSWDINDNPSYYSLRFGPKRLVHGHNDHMSLSYFCDGSNVLVDGGFHGYKGKQDKLRAFLLSPNAHNVVFSKDYRKYNWDLPTVLINTFQSSNYDFYTLFDKPYDGVERYRNILIDVSNDFFLIYDQIFSNKSAKFIQSWNIAPHLNSNILDKVAILTSEENSYSLIGDDSSKVTVVKGFLESFDENEKVIGGYIGLGHDHIEEINTIHYEKYGSNIEWYTAFSKSVPNNLIKINKNSFLLRDDFYRVSDDSEWLRVSKAKISSRVLDYHRFKVSFPSYFNILDDKIYIKNNTSIMQYFDINFNSLFTDGIHAFLISLNFECKSGTDMSYFYITASEGKMRFNTTYFYDKSSKNIVGRLPIPPHTEIFLVITLKNLVDIKEISFPSTYNLTNTIAKILQ